MNKKIQILLLTAITFTLLGIGTSIVFANPAEVDQEGVGAIAGALGGIGIGAGIAIGFAGLGAGIGLGIATSGVVAAGAERPEIMAKSFIFIVFIEAIAIYGLIVAIFIMTILPGSL